MKVNLKCFSWNVVAVLGPLRRSLAAYLYKTALPRAWGEMHRKVLRSEKGYEVVFSKETRAVSSSNWADLASQGWQSLSRIVSSQERALLISSTCSVLFVCLIKQRNRLFVPIVYIIEFLYCDESVKCLKYSCLATSL